jgi:hypothetical protein
MARCHEWAKGRFLCDVWETSIIRRIALAFAHSPSFDLAQGAIMMENIRGWLVSVRNSGNVDLYVVGADDRIRAQALTVGHCNAGLGHTVRVERALTEGEVDRYELSLNDVKRYY